VQDNMGRFWKVAQSDGKRSTRFVCYTKQGEQIKTLAELDVDGLGPHISRKRTGGVACNGRLYGMRGFQLCEKCAALVEER